MGFPKMCNMVCFLSRLAFHQLIVGGVGGIFRSNAFGFPRESVLKGKREGEEKKWTHQIWMNGGKFTEKKGGEPDREKDSTEILHNEIQFYTIIKRPKVSFLIVLSLKTSQDC